ncbi:MAG: hypothetical protein KF770_24645 [Anaerolineae bacterium]|nr:hypothetical protein [Anaerolineae bacterium]
METQTVRPKKALEQELIATVRALQPHRARQVLDFARWLQTQTPHVGLPDEEITPEELALEEKAWEATYLANQEKFREMAEQALNDLETGNTLELVIENGKVSTR